MKDSSPIVISDNNPVMPTDQMIADLAGASLGFGDKPEHIDWDRFYEHLEAEGWDMQDLGGKLDDRIRRRARKLRAEGKVEW